MKLGSQCINKSLIVICLLITGFTLEKGIVKLFDESGGRSVTVSYDYVRGVYERTNPKGRDKLFYLAAALRMAKENTGEYPPMGLLTSIEASYPIPFYKSETALCDSWGNPYQIKTCPVIVLSYEHGVVGDRDTYYCRLNTAVSTNRARAFLNSIGNLKMEADQ